MDRGAPEDFFGVLPPNDRKKLLSLGRKEMSWGMSWLFIFSGHECSAVRSQNGISGGREMCVVFVTSTVMPFFGCDPLLPLVRRCCKAMTQSQRPPCTPGQHSLRTCTTRSNEICCNYQTDSSEAAFLLHPEVALTATIRTTCVTVSFPIVPRTQERQPHQRTINHELTTPASADPLSAANKRQRQRKRRGVEVTSQHHKQKAEARGERKMPFRACALI